MDNPTNPPLPPAANTNDPQTGGGQFPVQNPGPAQPSVQSPGELQATQLQAAQAAPQPTAPAAQMPDPAGVQAAQNAQASNSNDVSVTTKNAAAKIIDDKDLIEKEYVEKARKIVEASRGDPYKQSEELTAFRADYMQKEYNKTIKTDK